VLETESGGEEEASSLIVDQGRSALEKKGWRELSLPVKAEEGGDEAYNQRKGNFFNRLLEQLVIKKNKQRAENAKGEYLLRF